MSLTFNAKTFNADSFGVNAVVYNGPAHTVSLKDDLALKRQAAKATATFSGLGRTQAKLSRTFSLTGALTSTGEGIISCDVAVPIGAASADIDAFINDFAALLALANFKTHVKSAQISF